MRLIIAAAVLLAGCANMTPEQIKAMQGQAGALCIAGANWNGSPLFVQYTSFGGHSMGTGGGGGVAKCGAAEFTFNNEGRWSPPPPPMPQPTVLP